MQCCYSASNVSSNNFQQRTKQVRKPRDDAFPHHEFQDRLSALVSAASKAGIDDIAIAKALESHAQSHRMRHAVNAPVPSAGVLPKTTVYSDNGSLRERVTAALKGEW
jgi:hypothetical protein